MFDPFFLDSEDANSQDNEDVVWDFGLIDPEMAPPDIREQVLQGYSIILETRKHLPEFAGDKISCTNCHFAGGNTLGGVNNGCSLVGVTKKYPRLLPDGTVLSLAGRINFCFTNSLNGKALPLDSPPMHAMITYLEWISSPVEKMEKMPWLSLRPIQSKHVANPTRGEKLYQTYCFECHGTKGEGQERVDDLSYPPIWGPDSFNNEAGMNELPILSSFIYQNMPYMDPFLTEEEALDIAAFVIKQERPKKID